VDRTKGGQAVRRAHVRMYLEPEAGQERVCGAKQDMQHNYACQHVVHAMFTGNHSRKEGSAGSTKTGRPTGSTNRQHWDKQYLDRQYQDRQHKS
jgi:hypothetical protein